MAQPAHAHPRRSVRAAVAALLATLIACVAALQAAGPVAATSPPLPEVVSVSPASGPAGGGTEVELGIAYDRGGSTAWFGGTSTSLIRENGKVRARVPAGKSGTTVDVQLTQPAAGRVYRDSSNRNDFTYQGRTRLALFATPTSGPLAGGNLVTLTGADAVFADVTAVRFGERTGEIVSKNSTSVVVRAPAGDPVTDVPLTVTHADGHVDGLDSDPWYRYGPRLERPQISSVTASEVLFAGRSAELTVKGRALEDTTRVEIAGVERWFTRRGDELTVSAGGLPAGSHRLVLTNGFGTSVDTPADDVVVRAVPPNPVIESLTPSQGPLEGGTAVTVRGQHFAELQTVRFDGTYQPLEFTAISDTEFRITTPELWHRGRYALVVRTLGAADNNDTSDPRAFFTFGDPKPGDPGMPPRPAPKPLTVTPNQGTTAAGGVIVLSGEGVDFESVHRATWREEFGRQFEIAGRTATSITLKSPEGWPGTGAIQLWSKLGQRLNTDEDLYTYVTTPISVQRVWPETGAVGGGTKVELKGNLDWVSSVQFGSAEPLNTWEQLPGVGIRVVAPRATSSGPVDITLRSAFGAETVVVKNGFTYVVVADPARRELAYTVSGTASLPTVGKGALPLKGKADLSLNPADGSVRGTLDFEPAKIRLNVLGGALPIVATVALVRVATLEGQMQYDLRLNGLYRVKITSASLFGALPLALGSTCQAKKASYLWLTTDEAYFDPFDGGGPLKASAFGVGDFNGCGALAPDFDAATTGVGSLSVKLARR